MSRSQRSALTSAQDVRGIVDQLLAEQLPTADGTTRRVRLEGSVTVVARGPGADRKETTVPKKFFAHKSDRRGTGVQPGREPIRSHCWTHLGPPRARGSIMTKAHDVT